MARAEAASASVSSDSIKGLAQSIAKPAYRRLLTAEPALRRAVPALIIAFLLTICVGAIVQVLDHRRQTISELVKQIDAVADLLADRLDRFEREQADKPDRRLQERTRSDAPGLGARAGPPDPDRQRRRHDHRGRPLRAGQQRRRHRRSPPRRSIPRRSGSNLIDVLGPVQPLTTLGAAAGVLEIPLADGTPAYATVRSLPASNNELAILHPRSDALGPGSPTPR